MEVTYEQAKALLRQTEDEHKALSEKLAKAEQLVNWMRACERGGGMLLMELDVRVSTDTHLPFVKYRNGFQFPHQKPVRLADGRSSYTDEDMQVIAKRIIARLSAELFPEQNGEHHD